MLDIAIPQNTGYPVQNSGTVIEMCRNCPDGYEGYSCEECAQVNTNLTIFDIRLINLVTKHK